LGVVAGARNFTLPAVRKRLCLWIDGSTLIPLQQVAAATQESNMSKLQIQIGTDTSIDTTEEGYEGGNAVMIESHNGTVCITGPFEGWMGYQELADLPIEQAG
jgi:hypothetical protein